MTITTPPGVNPATGEIQIRPFADILRDIGRGLVHEEASNALVELVASVQEHARKGTLTLTITVEPIKKGDASALVTSAQIKVTPPKGDPVSSVFFTDRHGNLTREDPNQMHLPLRGIPIPTPDQPADSTERTASS
jgi:hypothetical protein